MLQDLALLSLASVLFNAGQLDEALLATNVALEADPELVSTHLTIANIYAAKVRAFCYIYTMYYRMLLKAHVKHYVHIIFYAIQQYFISHFHKFSIHLGLNISKIKRELF